MAAAGRPDLPSLFFSWQTIAVDETHVQRRHVQPWLTLSFDNYSIGLRSGTSASQSMDCTEPKYDLAYPKTLPTQNQKI
jgi:hypothetical protein